MKGGLLLIVTLLLGALAASYLLQDNGYVLISFRGYVIEMSVPVLLVFFVLGYLAVRTLIRIWQAPRQLGEMVARHQHRKAGEYITRGYIEMGQGNFARGEKLLTRSVRNSDTPLLNYLAAARAAQAQGGTERRDNWLAMAQVQEPRAQVAVLLTQAELQLDNGEREAAMATLNEALQRAPNNPEVLRQKAGLALAAADWTELEQVLPRLRRYARAPVPELDEWTLQTWSALLESATGDTGRRRALLRSLPRGLRGRPQIIAAQARALLAEGEPTQAEALLRKALGRDPDESLLQLYSQPQAGDALRRLQQVERWLERWPDSPPLLQAAARLCVENELWGKARSYYEASTALQPTPQSLQEFGQLLLQLGEEQPAFGAFRRALESAIGGAPALPRLTGAARLDDPD